MFDIRTILLPFDFSPASRAAAAHAFEFARQLGAAVEIVLPQALEDAEADALVIGRGRDRGRVGQLWSHAYCLIRRSPVLVISV